MPNKPIDKEFEFHCLADHEYIWDFHPTSNQVRPDPIPPIEVLTPTGDVVYYLASKLPKRKTWLIFPDNFYTSLPLLSILCRRLDIGVRGTAKPSSRGTPAILAVPQTDLGKIPYHSKTGLILEVVGILLWFDNKPVTMMTTIHYLTRENSVMIRNQNRPGPKSSNHRQALLEFGDEYSNELQIPAVILDYNFHLGGVDIAD